MQAVVLSQFCQEPNYAQVCWVNIFMGSLLCSNMLGNFSHLMAKNAVQAFKFLEDSTEDGADSLYGCIWDMAILEFAMSLHTKRGEVNIVIVLISLKLSTPGCKETSSKALHLAVGAEHQQRRGDLKRGGQCKKSNVSQVIQTFWLNTYFTGRQILP